MALRTPNPGTLYDVAIVGYGPTGALLARLLGKQGGSVAVFERAAGPYPLPRAVHFDGEVMRVFQSAGITAELEPVVRASSKGMHFVNAVGHNLMIRRAIEGLGPQGWHSNYYFHQPDLENVLRRSAETCEHVHVKHSAEVVSITEEDSFARLQVRENGHPAASDFKARFVVGCDGANSTVRGIIGLGWEDLGLKQRWLVADLVLRRPPSEYPHLADYTVQYCDPAGPMTACYVTGHRRRWEMMIRPDEAPEDVSRPDNVWKTLSRWITPEDAELERTAIYTFRSLIANGWRRGRLMIAGDAAHQTPPFLGQGLCAGIRDCANLAWKLERVLKGSSPDSLLETYESERRPHVHAFIDLAVQVGKVIQADGAAAEERDRQFQAGGPREFEYPQPQLGPGIHVGPLPAGQISVQPFLSSGMRFDDAAAGRFALVSRQADDLKGDDQARRSLEDMGGTFVADPAFGAWLAEQHAVAAIIRPDGYVFGMAADAARLPALVRELRDALSR
jgi:3-(3-hydroxy-phenyl)propionate hydroxylase